MFVSQIILLPDVTARSIVSLKDKSQARKVQSEYFCSIEWCVQYYIVLRCAFVDCCMFNSWNYVRYRCWTNSMTWVFWFIVKSNKINENKNCESECVESEILKTHPSATICTKTTLFANNFTFVEILFEETQSI